MSEHEYSEDGMVYTLRELLELYKRTEYAITRTIFGETWTPSHAAATAVDRLRSLRSAETSGAGRRRFDEPIALIDRLAHLIRCHANGVKGEDDLHHALRLVQVPHARLGSVGIAAGGFREEIDQLVVTRHCLFLLEAKFQTRSYDIDAHGFLFGGAIERPYDITYRLARKCTALRLLLDAIYGEDGPEVPIRPCLVFMNHRVKVHNGCPGIRWFFVGDLLRYIEHVDDALYDAPALDVESVAEAIRAESVPYRQEPGLDIMAIYRDLRELFPAADDGCWRDVFTFAPGAGEAGRAGGRKR